jgi:glycerophosphoryl diester phosphodiesterase
VNYSLIDPCHPRPFLLLCLAAILAVTNASTAFCADPSPAQKLIGTPRPLIIAHRGNSSVAPENSLPAFQSAIDAKADLVELDYFHSSDGIPVVIHDEILDRTTNAEQLLGKPKLLIGDFPAAELQKLDIGAWFDEKFIGTRLPTLIESLDLIQPRSVTLIERKAGDAQRLVSLLEQKKLIDDVVVQAFDWKFIADCRKLSPRLALGTLSGKPASEEQIRAAAATGADLIVWDHKKIDREQIALIHQLGKKAWAYTIDDPARAAFLLASGLDGVITNKPAEMRRLVPSPHPQP